jgi:hypothetical protein
VANVDGAAAYDINAMGSTSIGTTKAALQVSHGKSQTVYLQSLFPKFLRRYRHILLGLNIESKAEVTGCSHSAKVAQVKIVSEPGDKPWKLREFMPADQSKPFHKPNFRSHA